MESKQTQKKRSDEAADAWLLSLIHSGGFSEHDITLMRLAFRSGHAQGQADILKAVIEESRK